MIIVPAVVYIRRKGYSFVEIFRLRPVNIKIVLLSIAIGIGILAPIDELDRILRQILPMPEEFIELEKGFSKSLKVTTGYNFAVLFFSGTVLASVAEEMLFRGFLQGILENSTDITRAVLVTSFLFAVVHLWPWMMVQILIVGVLLGVMVWKSNSIIPAIIVHFIFNSASLLIVNFRLKAPGWLVWKEHVSPVILIFSMILVYYSFKLFYNIYVKDIDIDNIEEGEA